MSNHPEAKSGAAKAPDAVDLRQEVHFCSSPDGVQLAYSMLGHGPPLVKTGNWMTHLEYDLETEPAFGQFLEHTRSFLAT